MNNRPKASTQENSAIEENRHLINEGHAMRRVVKNIVANMENVLTDLQGIMVDIQSLVGQIDTVTDKIDQQCAAQCDSGSSSNITEHCVRKPEILHGGKIASCAVHNMLYSQIDPNKDMNTSSEKTSNQNETSSHNVVQVKAYRTDDISETSVHGQQSDGPERTSETKKVNDVRLPCSSKRFSHLSFDGSGVASPSGGIAIVYPTIKSTTSFQPEVDYLEPIKVTHKETSECTTTLIRAGDESRHFKKSFLPRRTRLSQNPQHVMPTAPLQDNDTLKTKSMAAKQRHGITSVYNKFFQPVTPTEQRSPVIPVAQRRVKTKPFNNENIQASVYSNENKLFRVSYPIPEKSSVLNSPGHKYCTINSALAISLNNQRESINQAQYSPLMKRSTTSAVYNRLHGSQTINRSPVSIRRQGSEHYYFSIESDLDSDAVIETIDNRTMTPDIDWSYLNLIGNENKKINSSNITRTVSIEHLYETPVIASTGKRRFEMLQTSPDIVARLPLTSFQTQYEEQIYPGCDSVCLYLGQSILDQPFNTAIIAHVFCSEVSSFKLNGYCGCYESILDSVLENIAGFESFEEACDEVDNEEAIIGTYMSFEDEFEEDDWDVGMKSDDQGEYELSPFNADDVYHFDFDFFERLDTPDDNKNIFSAIDRTASVRLYDTDGLINSKCVSISASAQQYLHNATHNNKRRLSPVFSDADVYDNLVFPESSGKSFGDDDCCAMKANVNDHQDNFILLKKSVVPVDLHLFSERKTQTMPYYETEMSSSDDTSCQAVGTGSPMSFSSPEAALTSPDTDRFVTSSEGDDLFTSQDEGYFQFSDTQDNANTRMTAAKANMLQLRREFFESLYNVCDKRDKERLQCNDTKTIPEENIRYTNYTRMDNSRDNISEAGSYQEDIPTYNKNINTWTAYACVHIQSDDISDSTSDIFNDNNITCSMTSSYFDADNIGAAHGGQGLSC